jgi:hypothetical protein
MTFFQVSFLTPLPTGGGNSGGAATGWLHPPVRDRSAELRRSGDRRSNKCAIERRITRDLRQGELPAEAAGKKSGQAGTR